MTLSQTDVLKTLKSQFVCGYKNITGEAYAGKSGSNDTDGPAVETTNGAGAHNVQLFFLHADGTVLHCLPGFWAAEDLMYEIRFVQKVARLWSSDASVKQKKQSVSQAQLNAIRTMPKDMIQRSHLQGFDARHEREKKDSDFRFGPGDYVPPVATGKRTEGLKSTVQVIHERMAKRPFVPYEDFDVAEFSDYGRMKYDKKEKKLESGKK